VVVTGTGTEIGKTWVTAAVARRLRPLEVALRKPAQSFAPDDPPDGTDAAVLAAASGEQPATVCPPHRWYPLPLAPPMAAAALGRPPFTVDELVAEITASWPAGTPIGLVEGAGGVASPQADDGDMRTLIAALQPDLVVLVADAALGTLNLVRLSVAALGGWPLVVHCNRYDERIDLHRRNRAWLVERDGLDVTTDTAALADRVARRVVPR
jgi:dethiobiotin synthetase